MSNISITAANVLKGASGRVLNGTAGVAVTAGQTLYQHTDGKQYLASKAAALTAVFSGIALHAAAAGQPIAYLTQGDITIGGTLVNAAMYVLGADGAITPIEDLANGNWITYIGYAKSTTVLTVNPIVTGSQFVAA